MNKFVVGF